MPTFQDLIRGMPTFRDLIRSSAAASQSDEQARDHARALAQQWLVERAPEAARQWHQEHPEGGYPWSQVERDRALEREIQAQRDIRIDPEINRIAKIFYTALMQRIHFEFGHIEPDWDEQLGAREKKIWLEATELLLDELKKEPIAKTELGVIAKRRIIS